MIITFCPEINFAVSTFKPPHQNNQSSTVSIKQVKGIIHFIILHGSIFHPQNKSLCFLPRQYWSTVSMAHFLSKSHRMRAEPVFSLSWDHQPCHRYTSWWLSTKNRAVTERQNRNYIPGPVQVIIVPCLFKETTNQKSLTVLTAH